MGVSKELAWFQHLGWAIRGVSDRVWSSKKQPRDNEVDAERSFDEADAMERGVAREMTTSFVEAQPVSATRRRMRVERSEDRLQHVLLDEDGSAVLVARTVVAESRVEFFIADKDCAVDRTRTSAGPAFSMIFDKDRTNWRLRCSRCESCVYRARHCSCEAFGGQTIACIGHCREEIGGGVAMCMDVDIPEVSKTGSRVVWCPLRQGAEAPERIELASKRPTWNARLKSLVMDFKGRVDCASAKNFQLLRGDDSVLVFGKRGPKTFCLDFEHPLSTAQAFAIALTTMFWT